MSIEKNIENVKTKIAKTCTQLNRNPKEVSLIAVSKFQPAESIEAAYHCGLRDFAENYVQEWQKKSTQLSHLPDIRWHLIGPLQSNKVKFLTDKVYCLQSINSIHLAKELEKKTHFEKPFNVLIQLQVDAADTNKSGVSYESAQEIVDFILKSQKLNLSGFMGIGPDTNDKERLKHLYLEFTDKCQTFWKQIASNKKIILSLGMSQDLDVALECGSNMVRVGTAIFGRRALQSI